MSRVSTGNGSVRRGCSCISARLGSVAPFIGLVARQQRTRSGRNDRLRSGERQTAFAGSEVRSSFRKAGRLQQDHANLGDHLPSWDVTHALLGNDIVEFLVRHPTVYTST